MVNIGSNPFSQSSIGDEKTQKPALVLSKKSGSQVGTSSQVMNAKDQAIYTIALKKLSFFSIVKELLGKKVKVNAYDTASKTTSKYYASIKDICRACGLQPEEVVALKKQGQLEERILQNNAEAVDKLAERILLKDDRSQNAELKSQLARVKLSNLDHKISIFRSLSDEGSRVKLQDFIQLVNKTLGSPLDNIRTKFALNSQQFAHIKSLANFFPVGNLEILLAKATPEEFSRLLNTFIEADKALKKGLSAPMSYVKKTDDFYSFSLSADGQFFIAFDKLAAGSFKKVNKAVNVRNLEGMVKRVIRGEKDVRMGLKEETLQNLLAIGGNPFVMKPTHFSVLTRTSDKDSKTYRFQISTSKYVNFEKEMNGDGSRIPRTEIKKIAQFCHDFARGLSYLHVQGYVHGDVKPENALRNGNRAMVSDFGLTKPKGAKVVGGTPRYMPLEYLDEVNRLPFVPSSSKPSFDSFSLGVTILDMLIPNLFDVSLLYGNERVGLLTDQSRIAFFNKLKADARSNQDKIPNNEVNIKLQMLDLAEKLTRRDPEQRPSCTELAEALAKIPGIDSSNPPPV